MAFFIEVAVIFAGIALKDRVYLIMQKDMLASINSTNYGVFYTWNLLQQEVIK